jgi:hypothetical protein
VATEITVCHAPPRWPRRRVSELDRAIVTRWLSPLLPNLVLPDASRCEVELTYHRERIFAQWSIHSGERAIRSVHVEIWDAERHQPVEEYRSQLIAVIDRMQQLARGCGAQLLVEGDDLADTPPAQIVARVT